jgi:DNA-directed RNA polymerase specialized sigma24 family protein
MTLITQIEANQPIAHLIADMQQAQLLMVAGFVMLGWVLARRQIKMRKRVNLDARAANRAIKQIREHKDPALPLSDAPPETQRWQAAMFDLQRELKAELDTRIVIVQTLLRQVDQRIERLTALQVARSESAADAASTALLPAQHRQAVQELLRSGRTAQEIADAMGLSVGDVELTIATIGPT